MSKKVLKRKTSLRVLNEEFEADLHLGALLRQVQEKGKALLEVAAQVKKLGYEIPLIKHKDLELSVEESIDFEEGML